MRNIAVILAGGAGKRFGADKPKQLLSLEDGRSVLEHSVAAFAGCSCINEIIVVMHPDWIETAREMVHGVRWIAGGKERWESSWNAIQAIVGDANVLIHDAARPFVSRRIIEEVCEVLCTHEAVTVAVPATDTIYEVSIPRVVRGSSEGRPRVATIPERTTMMRAQTPQAFRLDVIKKAYALAIQDPALQATDDCGIVHKYLPDTPVYIVEGEETNRKITFREDL